ncbi:hypothetical protein R1flu_019852 [Riccia fluitans]|uniref:Protein kinase domain-containing protein n=1 Tax=Riccia fluitans TaxID=41844 RepID=A0ABD1ZNN2_9MARC
MAKNHSSKRKKKWIRGPCIGTGTHATIFLATNTENGKKFAVKSADRGNVIERLSLEVERRLLKACRSPYVIKYLGCDSTDRVKEMHGRSTFNLLIELVPRGSIMDHINRNGRSLPEEIVAAYTRDILLGLSYLHSHGIIHGDVKADNCLIGRDNIKLCDFGAGKFLADEDFVLEPRTRLGEDVNRIFTTGTPGWMAPEVEDEVEQRSPSDIYSLGCTVVEMCTGEPPFQDQFLDFSSNLRNGYSEECSEFIDLCLRENPRERPDAQELLEHVWFTRPFVYPVAKHARSRPESVTKRSTQPRCKQHHPSSSTGFVNTCCKIFSCGVSY